MDLPDVGVELKGKIADLLLKFKMAEDAIKEFKRQAQGSADLKLATQMQNQLKAFTKAAAKGEVKNAVAKMMKQAEDEAAKGGGNAAQRFIKEFENRMKKGKLSMGSRWLPLIGVGMLAAPPIIAGLAGSIGALATAGFGAAAGLGALASAASEVLAPVRQAFTAIDQLTTSNAVAANATALQTFLKAGPSASASSTNSPAAIRSRIAAEQLRIRASQSRIGSATTASSRLSAQASLTSERGILARYQAQLSRAGALGAGLGFLTNPHVNYATMTPAQQKALVLAAQSTAGMPASEKAQIAALMQERQAVSMLNPQQRNALRQYTRFDQTMIKAQTAAGPAVYKIFGAGLSAVQPVLKYITPMADAAAKALMPLIKELGTGFKSKGFADFIVLLQKMATLGIGTFGQALINFGKGFMHIFEALAKSGLVQIVLKDLLEMSKAFAKDTGPKNKGFMGFVSDMKKDAPIIDQTLRNLVALIGNLVKSMSGGFGRAELQGLNLFVGFLNSLAGLPFGSVIYNIAALILVFSKFGSLKALDTVWDMIIVRLSKLLAMQFGGFILGMMGMSAEGYTLAERWKLIGTAVQTGSKQAIVGMWNMLKTSAIWVARSLASAAVFVAGWVLSMGAWLASTVATALGVETTMLGVGIATGGIVIAIGLIVLAIYELFKHWRTVWGWIKRVAEDAWSGIKKLFVMYVKMLLTDPGIGLLWWAEQITKGIAWAFSWVPGLGTKLRQAANYVQSFVQGTNAWLNRLNPSHTTKLNYILGSLPAGITKQYGNRGSGGARKHPSGGGGSNNPLPGNYGGYPVHGAGTDGAAPGLAWVGERGPELVYFHGGEQVYSNSQSRQMMGYAKGTSPGLNVAMSFPNMGPVSAAIKATTSAVAREIASALRSELQTRQLPGGGLGASGPGVAAAEAFARRMLPLFGWGLGQMAPLISLWTRESGWRWNATNPSSGAYGIPQSLPASKMRSAGADWLTNPATQIRWGLGYIKQVYGSPAGAWAHEVANNWYASGTNSARRGWAMVGERGPELVRRGYASGTSNLDKLFHYWTQHYANWISKHQPYRHLHGKALEKYWDAHWKTWIAHNMHRVTGGAGSASSGGGGVSASVREQRRGATLLKDWLPKALKTVTEIRNVQKATITAINQYFTGPARRQRDDRVRDISATLQSLLKKANSVQARINNARAYRNSTASNLASVGQLSNLPLVNNTTMTGIATTTVDMATLRQSLAQLKQFGSVIKRLARAGLSKALIRQVIDMGVAAGLPYAQAILAGGGGLIKALNSTESQIQSAAELAATYGANAVYGMPLNNVGKAFLSSLRKERTQLDKEMQRLAGVLATALANWFHVPKSKRPKGFATGGMITEPIIGFGLSGRSYTFGEWGPEQVVPTGRSYNGASVPAGPASYSGGRGSVGPINIYTQEINPVRHAAELGWELARRSSA